MRTISNFKRWARTERGTTPYKDSFIKEVIARQGDAIMADIVAWGDRTIPKYIETPTASSTETILTAEGMTDYISCLRQIPTLFDPPSTP